MKILVVVSSWAKYPDQDKATGLWLGEAVHFVDKAEKVGSTCDFVSPQGGYTPIDPSSLAAATNLDWEYYQNKEFMNKLGATMQPIDVNPTDYAAIYYAGGHGAVWDFPDNSALQSISSKIYANGGIVSAVCHGVVGLLNIKLANGEHILQQREVTGFSNAEETIIELDKIVPYLTESALIAKNAIYSKASEPWLPYAISDRRVITGQNPASATLVADLVLKELGYS